MSYDHGHMPLHCPRNKKRKEKEKLNPRK